MKTAHFPRFLTASVISVSLLLASQVPAFAVGRPITSPRPTTPPGLMKSCQARESAINTRLVHLVDLADNMITVFDRHTNAVENYYTNTVLPSGKSVANYDSLLTDISAKKTAVETALTKAKTDSSDFSCTTGSARDLFTLFREDMIAVIRALKDYRTSIKNLIVAVAKVAPESSPTPVASPSPEK